jgi:hydroxymethylbilane synthase
LIETRALKIGTRGSRLALWQAHAVADRLRAAGIGTEMVTIRTTGDRSQAGPIPGADTKRQFVKEIEDALLAHEIDLAVHSAKDLPAELPDGLALASCLPREDPRDALVLPRHIEPSDWTTFVARLAARANGTIIGTGSVRRIAQLGPALPGAAFRPIRGNVDTRVNKLDGGEFDALVLACAGLRRLGFADRISCPIPIEQCVPAPGQGIVATEIRASDDVARELLSGVHDEEAGRSLEAERTLVKVLGGGCQLPLGALGVPRGQVLELHAVVASLDGSQAIRRTGRGRVDEAGEIGRRLAEDLLHAGARALLDGVG